MKMTCKEYIETKMNINNNIEIYDFYLQIQYQISLKLENFMIENFIIFYFTCFP